jgi:hypothetical protein
MHMIDHQAANYHIAPWLEGMNVRQEEYDERMHSCGFRVL